MASNFALRRIASSVLSGSNLHRPFRSLSVAPSFASRSFNTNAQMTRMDDHDRDDREGGIDRVSDRSASRRRDFPAFFADVFDPLSPTRSVSQLMNMMDQLMENPLSSGARGMGALGGARRGWDAREDENALYLKMDMPGLGKEDVKVSMEESTLTIKGEQGGEESEEEKRRYSTRIDLTPNLFKIDAIKAEMKNGVLKVVVPKVKEDERKDVFQIQVE
ncbi:hypothetical protein V2J09_020707 [Rumex salicifolius]